MTEDASTRLNALLEDETKTAIHAKSAMRTIAPTIREIARRLSSSFLQRTIPTAKQAMPAGMRTRDAPISELLIRSAPITTTKSTIFRKRATDEQTIPAIVIPLFSVVLILRRPNIRPRTAQTNPAKPRAPCINDITKAIIPRTNEAISISLPHK